MNQVIASLLNIRPRQIITVFLVGLTFWGLQAFGYSNQLQAHAKALTPEASAYQVDNADSNNTPQIQNDNKLVENSREDLKATADNVREKLNLDQPIYPGTKEFLNDIKESTQGAVDTVTGNDKGDNK
ncbi:MAG TPA: hypothetical protein V6C91_03575 [Coleofasciculaceae cyanobacterium]